MSPAVRFLILSFLVLNLSVAQSPNGTISGIVHDPSDRPIPDAEIIIVNDLTNIQYQTRTSDEGIYVVGDLPPGSYRIQVTKRGFKTLIKPGLILNVQNALSVSITLPLGAVTEVVTVQGGAPLINTTDASVSTVVDRQFAENLPMNGRSFQTLIYLTPGVVATQTNTVDNGQFSVNGQRPSSNYWMVDGVSANIGIGVTTGSSAGNGLAGSVGSFSALGGTNSLVSVDAMQEFRIQTSTYAPEFGRTPGAQISIATRSGANGFHGTAFDYLRNNALDANNWFANSQRLPKPEERQNDFGGTFSGPIIRDKAFFFFSYEGLRLQLPETTLSNVPDLAARQTATTAIQPYLNAFPLPNGLDNHGTGIAAFNASYSNPASLDAYSLRVDYHPSQKWSFFGRYNYSPSEFSDRGLASGAGPLNDIQHVDITTQTGTAGATWDLSPVLNNDVRFNYSWISASSNYHMDDFGGAAPLEVLPFPSPYTSENALLQLFVFSLGNGQSMFVGEQAQNIQRQVNIVDNLNWQRGSHALKFGVDWRRLSPSTTHAPYQQTVSFPNVSTFTKGLGSGSVIAYNPEQLLFRNLGLFAQDTWRVLRHLTLTYGLRWDVDWAPSSLSGPSFPAVTGYNLMDLSKLAIAPSGTGAFGTRYGNFAPRLGVAWQISAQSNWETVLRGGFGVFYDLVNSETGSALNNQSPFGKLTRNSAQPYPWTPEQIASPVIPPTASLFSFTVFNPEIKLPYTLQWNMALEQALGGQQTISVSYIGAVGRRLLQTTELLNPPTNPNISLGNFIDNSASSNYTALQVQFQRRLTHGVQALASYTWSHSIDDASAGSFANSSNLGNPGNTALNRGSSDFDIRNAFSAGVTWDIPTLGRNTFTRPIFGGWSVQQFFLARSAPPVDLVDENLFLFDGGINANIRPDVVLGQPLYLFGPQYPGGKALNPRAFVDPPLDPNTGAPLRQGNLSRNALRGFGATEWDLAVHRDFPVRERLKLQFRAEMFNVLNHPNFGSPNNQLGIAGFGLSQQTLAQSLSNGSAGIGGFNPLYQIGGPRSIQLALKVIF
jgi:Carboxypeptidase regulatory-like domain/TonB dependent receptor